MKRYEYLIVGGGMATDSAVQGIRAIDPEGSIGVVSAEPDPPYDRPPLSKGLWTGDVEVDEIWRSTADYSVDLLLARTVQRVDPATKTAIDDHDEAYQYEKLLLATGGTPRRLPNDIPEIIYYRTFRDYRRLVDAVDAYDAFGIIGGGFIGSEIAAALTMRGKEVTMIFPEGGVAGRVLPEPLSQHLNAYFAEHGTTVFSGDLVTAMARQGSRLRVDTREGRQLSVDCLVAGIGIRPNVQLAETAGLAVDNGILVDEFLRTSNPNIYAAGDVANFMNPHLGKRIRVEHEDNANTMGDVAGKNMAGQPTQYDHLPSFYSDLFDLGYEAVGELDAQMQIVADWTDEFHEGVIYYLGQHRVRGVVLWNVWDQVGAAREIIADRGPFTPENVIGLLPKDTE
jgi:NADPH-dependent 2,4-dienoyl-CoA reductase/sulfur reductase-like enzyme